MTCNSDLIRDLSSINCQDKRSRNRFIFRFIFRYDIKLITHTISIAKLLP